MFRLQQQGWDQGVMDLLSKWQGWTDTVERSEAVHFEEESVLMAQLISHQQQMTEVHDLVSHSIHASLQTVFYLSQSCLFCSFSSLLSALITHFHGLVTVCCHLLSVSV